MFTPYTRVYTLAAVAEGVLRDHAVVREHELSQVRDDIDAIASKRVTGPVFRLLTKGRLRR